MGYSNKNLFRRYPNAIARTYGVGVHGYTHRQQLKGIKELLALAESQGRVQTILDCPCGSGRVAAELGDYDLTCADHSANRIRMIREILSNPRLKADVCDVYHMPYAKGAFDLVLNVLLLQHIPKAKLAPLFQEVARVTRRWVIMTYSHTYSALSLARRFSTVPNCTLTQGEFDELAAGAGLLTRARRFVIPGVAATVIVLLEKR